MKLVLASSNHGKLQELSQLLAGNTVELLAQSDLGVEDADETGSTFVENALIKARHATRTQRLPLPRSVSSSSAKPSAPV